MNFSKEFVEWLTEKSQKIDREKKIRQKKE